MMIQSKIINTRNASNFDSILKKDEKFFFIRYLLLYLR